MVPGVSGGEGGRFDDYTPKDFLRFGWAVRGSDPRWQPGKMVVINVTTHTSTGNSPEVFGGPRQDTSLIKGMGGGLCIHVGVVVSGVLQTSNLF